MSTKTITLFKGKISGKILFRFVEEHRDELYYVFGVACLGSWFAFNLWVLRDYFFPCWFPPIYTADGFLKVKLLKKKHRHFEFTIVRKHSCYLKTIYTMFSGRA